MALSSGEVRAKAISEFVALLVIIVIALVSAIIYFAFVGGVLGSLSPKVRYLEASTAGTEVIYAGAPTKIDVGGSLFTASYIYRLNVILHNAGNQPIRYLSFQTVTVSDKITVCWSDSCTVYDPVLYTETFTSLPTEIGPNQVIKLSFVVLSKKDLLATGSSPFVIKVTGTLPDGSTITAYAPFSGG